VNQEDFADMPPGVLDFAWLEQWASLAYTHRASSENFDSRWDRGPKNVVHLPDSVDEARAFALVHLRELKSAGAAVVEKEVEQVLESGGHAHAAAGLNAPDPSQHPENRPLHAWWLKRQHWRGNLQPQNVPVLRRCVEMFADKHPQMAFIAAMHLAQMEGAEQIKFREQALELFVRGSKMSRSFAMEASRYLVGDTQKWSNAVPWQEAVIHVQKMNLAGLPNDWAKPQPRDSAAPSRHAEAWSLLSSLRACGRWKEVGELIEEEARHQEPAESVMRRTPFISYGRGGPLLGDDALCFPNLLLRWPQTVTEALGVYQSAETRSSSQQHQEGPWTQHLRDPWLKLMARWRFGDVRAVRDEITQRLASPDATLTDCWAGAWLAWEADTDFPNDEAEQAAARLAAERLTRAAAFPVEGVVRTHLDAALLRTMLALRERSDLLLEAARGAARRFCRGTVASTYDAGDLYNAFETLGFHDEALRIHRAPVVPHVEEALKYRPQLPAQDTLSRLRRQPPRDEEVSRQSPPNVGTFVSQALRRLHKVTPDNDLRGDGRQLVTQAREWKFEDALSAAVAPRADATAREHLRAGYDYELLGLRAKAVEQYESATRLSPALHEARGRLALLLLPDQPDKALAQIEAVTPGRKGTVIEALCKMALMKEPASLSALQLLTRWLQQLADAGGTVPGQALYPIQNLMSGPGADRAALCRVARHFPYLDDAAFRSIAEEALARELPLTSVAAQARAMLKAKASPRAAEAPTMWVYSNSRAMPDQGVITQPGPALILIWDAWQRNAASEIESDVIPLLRSAGHSNEEPIRLGAELFFCPPDKFIECAGRFLRSDQARMHVTGHSFTDVFADGGTLDFITLVWRLRKLEGPLESLFLAEMDRTEARGSSLQALVHYINLAPHLTSEAARKLVRGLRDNLVGTDPELRKLRIAGTRERSRYALPDVRWQRKRTPPPGVSKYTSMLTKLIAEPKTCRAAMEMAEEDGLTKNHDWRVNEMMAGFTHGTRSPDELIRLMEGFSMLGPPEEFRTWAMEPDRSSSLFDMAVGVLTRSEPESKAALEMVRSRKPETFGQAMVLTWASLRAVRELEEHKILAQFVNAHGDELARIPVERWPEVGFFFKRTSNWETPWNLSLDERVTWMPLVKAQGRYLAHFAPQVLTHNHWEDVEISCYMFIEQTSRAFVFLAESDPAKAISLAKHTLALLAKPPKHPGPPDVNTPKNPRHDWVFSAVPTVESLAVLRSGLPEIENDHQLKQVLAEAERRLKAK